MKNDEVSINVDTLIVGAGLSGLMYAQHLRRNGATDSLLVLESEDRVLGRSSLGLHLLDAEAAAQLPLLCSDTYGPAKIRWQKQWVSFSEVDWEDSDWVASLPQWSVYLQGSKVLYLDVNPALLNDVPPPPPPQFKGEGESGTRRSKKKSNSDAGAEPTSWILYNTPVSALEALSDSEYAWKACSPQQNIYAKKVIWAAGMMALQNAFGKVEAQKFLDANPFYQKEAADYLGGISLTLEFAEKPVFEEGFDERSVWALPVRHGGKLSLMIGVLAQLPTGEWAISTLTHVSDELLSEPKELLSYQKSLRRSIKNILRLEFVPTFEKVHERWVVAPKVGAHMLGNPWCFAEGDRGGLEFIGEQTLAAARSGHLDIVSALLELKSDGKLANFKDCASTTVEIPEALSADVISDSLALSDDEELTEEKAIESETIV